ncbi:MAG: UDP-N-acetylglucosamine 2-epimerase (non-hydrolyzing) [Parcubacteria group bacterium CG10_big_fil_rev_8_21_14_0_10_36_14]|nr:MAG: UDP-N-acetylglucosamine 2-epimerase (non-hydrolyzing) [Parcubacteria group bacterium CG10_big_fil_rev_8_21_14_0_10_36_14]
MKKILFIAGARPNFMKISALTRAASLYADKLQIGIIHTGQHYDDELSEVFFREFKMPRPLANLGIGSGSRREQIGKTLKMLSLYIRALKPDLIVVVGDVNSTLAGALAGASENVPVAHVEAGLRSFNWKMPEEANRVMTDHLSDFLFVTENSAVNNLKAEGITEDKVFFSGNVMIDTLLHFGDLSERSDALVKNSLTPKGYALLTLHRTENVSDGKHLAELLFAINEINKSIPVICPLHPRTEKALKDFNLTANFTILGPQPYLDFINLQKNAEFVLTDSGGIQEETTIFNVPCITLREETERPVTCELGTNEVVGRDKEKIFEAVGRVLNGEWKKREGEIMGWDGNASKRIMGILAEHLNI